MATDVDIANMALGRLGTRATVADLAENSTEARALNAHFTTVRDTLLRARNWNFSRKVAALSLSGTAPGAWTYSYAYPSDCLRVLRLDIDGGLDQHDALMAFELGTDGTSRLIWTDLDEAYIVYTQRITDPTRFDPMFTSCFVDALAAAVAYPITTKSEIAVRLGQIARASLEAAAADSANEDQTSGWADWDADSITARG